MLCCLQASISFNNTPAGSSSIADSSHSSASGSSGSVPFGVRSGAAAGASKDHPLSPQEAAECLMEAVYELNACVPYAGVSTDADAAALGSGLQPGETVGALAALAALLPQEGLSGPAAASALGPDDVKLVGMRPAPAAGGRAQA